MADYAIAHKLPYCIADIGADILRFCIEQKRLPAKPREALTKEELQVLVDVGKEMRDEDENFWLERIEKRIENRPLLVIVPNIRYANEAAWVDERGFLIRVTALNMNGSPYISPDRDPNHDSETELEFARADYYITAYRDQVDVLRGMAVAVLENILCRCRM